MQPVKLYIRTADEIGKRNYAVADLKKQPERGVYYLRVTVNGKRRWKSVGKSLKLALIAKANVELQMLEGKPITFHGLKPRADRKSNQSRSVIPTKKRTRSPKRIAAGRVAAAASSAIHIVRQGK